MAAVELPPIVGGRYRPIRLLGRGGMGVVYEVEHLHTGQRLAMKVLAPLLAMSPQVVERFQREARAPAQIKSEHVVTVTDADVAPELGHAPYVVMELLDGADLEALAGTTAQAPERVVGWLRQIARALDKAHRLGIVHRDLKPANLFVSSRYDGSELVKILDFGIAKMLDANAATGAGEILGTPAYMSPEQVQGSADVAGAADRLALGLIAYRLLFGRVYWRTNGLAQLVNEILYAPREAPSARESTLGPPFDEWFAKATARDPAARFESAAEQVEALAEALALPTLEVGVGGPVTPVYAPRSGSPPTSSGSIQEDETVLAEAREQPSPRAHTLPSVTPSGKGGVLIAPFGRSEGSAATPATSGGFSGEPPALKRRPTAGVVLTVGGVLLAVLVGGIVRALRPPALAGSPDRASAMATTSPPPDAFAPATSSGGAAMATTSAPGRADSSAAPIEALDGGPRRSARPPVRPASTLPTTAPRTPVPRDPLEDQN